MGGATAARRRCVIALEHVLGYTGRRLAGAPPSLVRADVCKPLPVAGPFDSAALNLVLHCLPASGKADAVRHVADVQPGRHRGRRVDVEVVGAVAVFSAYR